MACIQSCWFLDTGSKYSNTADYELPKQSFKYYQIIS